MFKNWVKDKKNSSKACHKNVTINRARQIIEFKKKKKTREWKKTKLYKKEYALSHTNNVEKMKP